MPGFLILLLSLFLTLIVTSGLNVTHNKSGDGCYGCQTPLSRLPGCATEKGLVCDATKKRGTGGDGKRTGVISTVQIGTFPRFHPSVSFSVFNHRAQAFIIGVFFFFLVVKRLRLMGDRLLLGQRRQMTVTSFSFTRLRVDEWRLGFSQLFLGTPVPQKHHQIYIFFVLFFFQDLGLYDV